MINKTIIDELKWNTKKRFNSKEGRKGEIGITTRKKIKEKQKKRQYYGIYLNPNI